MATPVPIMFISSAAIVYGRSSSYLSFTDKKLRPREAEELAECHRCQVHIFLALTVCCVFGGGEGKHRSWSQKPRAQAPYLLAVWAQASCLYFLIIIKVEGW